MADQRGPANEAGFDIVAPAARAEDLVITESGDEVLVYDKQRHHIHHLNPIVSVVWRLCDGRLSMADIAAQAALPSAGGVEIVRLALAQLAEAHLLENAPPPEPRAERRSRRTVLRRAMIGSALAMPVIVSMTAPTPAMASSNCPGFVIEDWMCKGDWLDCPCGDQFGQRGSCKHIEFTSNYYCEWS